MKTDLQLQTDVMAELKWEPAVNAANMGVQVKDGIVTLTGHVDSYLEKLYAEQAAQRVGGVKALAVEVVVKLPQSGQRSDADIARSAKNVLEWTSSLGSHDVKVMVEKGWITLTGTLDWQYQRQAAADAIRHLMGVTGVSNQIVLRSSVLPSTVKHDIEAALERLAKDDAQKIRVQVSQGNVILSGNVPTWTERDAARNAAWCTPGVSNVVDHIHIGAQ